MDPYSRWVSSVWPQLSMMTKTCEQFIHGFPTKVSLYRKELETDAGISSGNDHSSSAVDQIQIHTSTWIVSPGLISWYQQSENKILVWSRGYYVLLTYLFVCTIEMFTKSLIFKTMPTILHLIKMTFNSKWPETLGTKPKY